VLDRGGNQCEVQVQSEAEEHSLTGERAEREESGGEDGSKIKKTKHRVSGWDPAWVDKPRFHPWLYHTDHGKYSAVHHIRHFCDFQSSVLKIIPKQR